MCVRRFKRFRTNSVEATTAISPTKRIERNVKFGVSVRIEAITSTTPPMVGRQLATPGKRNIGIERNRNRFFFSPIFYVFNAFIFFCVDFYLETRTISARFKRGTAISQQKPFNHLQSFHTFNALPRAMSTVSTTQFDGALDSISWRQILSIFDLKQTRLWIILRRTETHTLCDLWDTDLFPYCENPYRSQCENGVTCLVDSEIASGLQLAICTIAHA